MGFMIAPLEFTITELEVWRLLYSKSDFNSGQTKYTRKQLLLDSDPLLQLTERKIGTIINNLLKQGYIKEIEKGVKGKPTIYFIDRERVKTCNLCVTDVSPIGNLCVPNNVTIPTDTAERGNLCVTDVSPIGNLYVNPINRIEYNNKDSANVEVEKISCMQKINEYFEEHWKLYPVKKGKSAIKDTRKKELYKLGDELERCIDRYISNVEQERVNGFKDLKFQNGSTFFNGGYVDYLDENIQEDVQAIKSKPSWSVDAS